MLQTVILSDDEFCGDNEGISLACLVCLSFYTSATS